MRIVTTRLSRAPLRRAWELDASTSAVLGVAEVCRFLGSQGASSGGFRRSVPSDRDPWSRSRLRAHTGSGDHVP